MTSLRVAIKFATPFRFGTGKAGAGVDEQIDPAQALRADSIKGLMRAEARVLLPSSGLDHELVQGVFGSQRVECPWNFSVELEQEPVIFPRANVRLGERRRAVKGAFFVKEEAAAKSAMLTIESKSAPSVLGVPSESSPLDYHLALLHLSAVMVEKAGQKRTRGLGWVSCEVAGRSVEGDLGLLWPLRSQGGN